MEKTMSEMIREEQGGSASLDEVVEGVSQPVEESKGFFSRFDFGFLTAETGEGNREDYIDHPLNFCESLGLSRMLRGLTGMLGNLRLAIVDIVFGAMEFMQERRGNNG